jgi:hypothetical protein
MMTRTPSPGTGSNSKRQLWSPRTRQPPPPGSRSQGCSASHCSMSPTAWKARSTARASASVRAAGSPQRRPGAAGGSPQRRPAGALRIRPGPRHDARHHPGKAPSCAQSGTRDCSEGGRGSLRLTDPIGRQQRQASTDRALPPPPRLGQAAALALEEGCDQRLGRCSKRSGSITHSTLRRSRAKSSAAAKGGRDRTGHVIKCRAARAKVE